MKKTSTVKDNDGVSKEVPVGVNTQSFKKTLRAFMATFFGRKPMEN